MQSKVTCLQHSQIAFPCPTSFFIAFFSGLDFWRQKFKLLQLTLEWGLQLQAGIFQQPLSKPRLRGHPAPAPCRMLWEEKVHFPCCCKSPFGVPGGSELRGWQRWAVARSSSPCSMALQTFPEPPEFQGAVLGLCPQLVFYSSGAPKEPLFAWLSRAVGQDCPTLPPIKIAPK